MAVFLFCFPSHTFVRTGVSPVPRFQRFGCLYELVAPALTGWAPLFCRAFGAVTGDFFHKQLSLGSKHHYYSQ
jgi:hypothetical protein